MVNSIFKKYNIQIGTDPETFITKGGETVSAIGIIQGTKEEPQKIGKDFYIQQDNVLFEFNVPPAVTAKEMFDNINFVFNWFKQNMSEYNLLIEPIQTLKAKYLKHPLALAFGCDPDINCWTGRFNVKPDVPKNLRSAGGHVHVSSDKLSLLQFVELARLLDLYLGIPSVLLDPNKKRRKIYGKSGAIRLKQYTEDVSGVEYRVLSNFWIKDLESVEWVFNQIEKALIQLENEKFIDPESQFANDIQHCINNSDISLAKKLIKEHNL